MTFYFLLKGEDKNHIMYDANILGYSTKKAFYPEQGLQRLMKISEKFPKLLKDVSIYDDNNEVHTIEKFLEIISKLIIIQQ